MIARSLGQHRHECLKSLLETLSDSQWIRIFFGIVNDGQLCLIFLMLRNHNKNDDYDDASYFDDDIEDGNTSRSQY